MDEAVLYDHFFLSNICPIYFIETLADLDKIIKSGRSPEEEVSRLALKTPENGQPNKFHIEICTGNLLGYEVPMRGRQILISGGKPVKSADRTGYVVEPSLEQEALSRWQEGQFHEVEKRFAMHWRTALKTTSFKSVVRAFNKIGINPKRCKTLEQAKQIAETMVGQARQSAKRIDLIFSMLNIPPKYQGQILTLWGDQLYPPLPKFAPYAAHVLTVHLFYFAAMAAGLVSRQNPSTRMDMAYLYYLPFSMMFVSSDKLHRRCAPLFLRNDQAFVWGPDLKADLKRLDEHYSALPERKREQGLHAFASRPPDDDSFLTTRLWKRFLRPGVFDEKPIQPRSDETSKKFIEHIKKMAEAKALKPSEVDFDMSRADALVVKKKISKRRGKWWQVPKDLPEQ